MSIGSLCLIFLIDIWFRIASPGFIIVAVLDELAHLATALVFILCLWRVLEPRLVLGFLAGAVLIDIDHIPGMLESGITNIPPERPVTHSLVPIFALLVTSLALSGRARWTVIGATVGLLSHVFRDMATGGVPLAWPVHAGPVEIQYSSYAAILLATAVVPVIRSATEHLYHDRR